MSERVLVVLIVGAAVLPFLVITVIVSLLRGTPVENGLRAIGWLIVVLIAAGAVGSAVDPSLTFFVTYLAGAVATYSLARRDGYELDRRSWLLLALWFIGYWIVFWRRENALWERRRAAVVGAR